MSLDPRETAWDPFEGSFDAKTMTGLLYGEDVPVRCHYEVCKTCHGNGTHVNPSIDSNGISAEDFYDDPEFADNYFGGVYDVQCAECRGLRVVPVPNDEDPNKAAYDEAVQERYEYMAEVAAERRVGA